MVKKISAIIFYIIAILFIGIYGIIELKQNVNLSEGGRLFLLCGSCVFLYFGGLLLSKYRKDNKPMKINLWIFFILYLLLFITLTLFDEFWGRNGLTFNNWSKGMFSYYMDNCFNVIPFKTIIEYLGEFNSLLNTKTFMLNLVGNVIACMPFAFFLPLLFRRQNNIKIFTLTIIIIVLAVELLQFATLSGICDIDDIILNVLGALVMYGILKIASISNLIKNIFLLEKNKIEKKSIIKIAVGIIIVFILAIILIKFRQKLYDTNYNERMSKYNFSIQIVDESDTADTALEQFYEDEYHIYYFESIKSDKVYAIINNNEKYLVKDLLNNNPTEYEVTIQKLKNAGLQFITKNKYEEIMLKGSGNVSSKVSINDNSILEIGYGESNYIMDNQNQSYYEMQFFIIPLKSGNTEFEVELIDNESNEIVSIEKYKVDIDNNLKVTYEKVDS